MTEQINFDVKEHFCVREICKYFMSEFVSSFWLLRNCSVLCILIMTCWEYSWETVWYCGKMSFILLENLLLFRGGFCENSVWQICAFYNVSGLSWSFILKRLGEDGTRKIAFLRTKGLGIREGGDKKFRLSGMYFVPIISLRNVLSLIINFNS